MNVLSSTTTTTTISSGRIFYYLLCSQLQGPPTVHFFSSPFHHFKLCPNASWSRRFFSLSRIPFLSFPSSTSSSFFVHSSPLTSSCPFRSIPPLFILSCSIPSCSACPLEWVNCNENNPLSFCPCSHHIRLFPVPVLSPDQIAKNTPFVLKSPLISFPLSSPRPLHNKDLSPNKAPFFFLYVSLLSVCLSDSLCVHVYCLAHNYPSHLLAQSSCCLC